MSYDLSFDKRHAALLAICLGVIAALLVAAGFLLGLRHAEVTPRPPAEVSLLAVPVETAAKSHARDSQAPTVVPAAASLPSIASPPGTMTAPVSAAAPPAADAPATFAPNEESVFTLQFGAFEDRGHAENQVKKLKAEGVVANIHTAQDRAGRTWYAVRSGSYPTIPLATEAAEKLRTKSGEVVLVRSAREL